GSQATVSPLRMPPDATVVRAFLFWSGTFNNGEGIPLDRTVDFRLPDGTFINNLNVDIPRPGEPASTLNRCVQRNHTIGPDVVPMFSCRREVTFLLQQLGTGGAVGSYEVSDVDLSAGDCLNQPGTCQAKY